MNPRRLLLELFDAALRAVDGERCVPRALHDLPPRPVALFAVGKAASSMTLGAYSLLGERVAQALVITKDGHVDPRLCDIPGLLVMESAHPIPDERSLAAGAELERRVAALSPESYPLFLVSGGSSSLVEALRPGTTLADLRALNVRGLAAGWDIERLNAERGKVSRLKAGGITALLGDRPAHALFVSDVPADDPDVIGAGLLGRAARKPDTVRRRIVANVDAAVHAAIEAAAARGFELETRECRFAGDAAHVAAEFVAALRSTSADGLVWGGESTVQLPPTPGRGGRNQHLALSAAMLLQPGDDIDLIAVGTDGSDGPTEDAGAIVDGGTVSRAELGGVDVERALRGCDSGLALEAAEDLVHTGPTGTNVGDLLIGIKRDARGVRDPGAARML